MLNCKAALNHFQWAMLNNHSDQLCALSTVTCAEQGMVEPSLILSMGGRVISTGMGYMRSRFKTGRLISQDGTSG